MNVLLRLSVVLVGVFTAVGFWPSEAQTPTVTTPQPVATILEAPRPLSVAPTTTTTTLPVPEDALCPQWWPLAVDAGWTLDLLPTLDYVIWRESRCNPTAHNTTLNRDKSTDVGLTQVNDKSWCLPTKWRPDGYLQTVGVLSTVGCEQLFDPYTNLLAAKVIHDYADRQYGNGWQPWSL